VPNKVVFSPEDGDSQNDFELHLTNPHTFFTTKEQMFDRVSLLGDETVIVGNLFIEDILYIKNNIKFINTTEDIDGDNEP